MDGKRFDGWTKKVATEPTRRRVLAGLAGGALAALGLGLGERSVAARPSRRIHCNTICASQPKGQRAACLRSCQSSICSAEHNFCTDSSGACGDDPDCICSNTSVGIVCHHLSCANCADCASDADCVNQGNGAASVCISHDDCCSGSSCLTPCDQACDVGAAGARQRSYGR